MFSSKKLFIQSQPQKAAFFRLGDNRTSAFFVSIENQETIQKARNILQGIEQPLSIGGTIVDEPVCWNPSWSYHYDPKSVYFFEMSVEVCDASYEYVENNLADVGGSFLPQNNHCPWGSFLIEEVDGSCPIEKGINAYCCEVQNSYNSSSNTKRVNINFFASSENFPDSFPVPADWWANIEVDYGDGQGWGGFNHIKNPDCFPMCSFEAPLFPGTKNQRYRVRIQDSSTNPTNFTDWSYTNPVAQFQSPSISVNPVCLLDKA